MPRRALLPADVILDRLAEGKRQKELGKPSSIADVLRWERRRQNCRTNMQLLAVHLKRKLGRS